MAGLQNYMAPKTGVEIADIDYVKKIHNTAQAIDYIKSFRKNKAKTYKKIRLKERLKKVLTVINNAGLTRDEP